MHLERRTVSRKTPRDGKLEISRAIADRLEAVGVPLRAEWRGDDAAASLIRMSCTCGGGDARHEHHFLESSVLRALPVGEDVDLTLDEADARVTVTPSAPGRV